MAGIVLFDFLINSACVDSETGTVLVVALAAVAFLVLSAFGAFIGYERLSKRKEGNLKLMGL